MEFLFANRDSGHDWTWTARANLFQGTVDYNHGNFHHLPLHLHVVVNFLDLHVF